MSRPIWKGHISFGLVNIPVTLFSADQTNEMKFRMIDSRNNSGIKYQRINEATKEEVPWENIVKGFEHEEGRYVMLGDEDFRRAAPEATQSIDIESFVPSGDIPPEHYEKPYYLVPGKKGERPYALLREALTRSGCAGIAKVIIRSRQHLAALIVRDRAMILEILRFPNELREVPLDKIPGADLEELKITSKELALADQLVASMKGDWEPGEYKDVYKDSLMAWIEQKAEKGETAPLVGSEEEAEDTGATVIDMMELLKKSMEKAGQRAKADEEKAG